MSRQTASPRAARVDNLVDIVAQARVPAGLRPRLRLVLGRLMRSRGLRSEICVVLTDDARIRALKLEHWGEDAPTDVLSFPQWEPGDPFVPPHLGDIVISLETARRQADERGHGLDSEVAVLASHGLTHLLGHDHEDEAGWAPFRAAEREALEALEAPGPPGLAVIEPRPAGSRAEHQPPQSGLPDEAVLPAHARTHPWNETFYFAWAGVLYAWRTQRNLRAEVGLGLFATALCLALGVNPAPVLACAALVLSLEMVNTAFEALTDLAAPTFHPLAKVAKDVAAGAVLVAALVSLLVGLFTVGPSLLAFVGWLVGGR